MGNVLGIYGAGGLGREVLELAKLVNTNTVQWDRYVFVDDGNVEHIINGISVLTEKDAKEQFGQKLQAIIAVGEPAIREKIYLKLSRDNIMLTTLIHPSVHIPDCSNIAAGVVICNGVTITCNADIMENVYIQPNAVIGHDVSIGKHSVISANCQIGGECQIGERVYMGFLSGTKQGLKIGNDVICSAGAIVFRDIEDAMIVVGNPARIMKKNERKRVFS